MSHTDADVVIVGAGPYGLSIAAYLQATGIAVRVFGEPMSSWRKCMPHNMLLKSEGFASSLYDPEDSFTLRRFSSEAGIPYEDIGRPVPLETFVSYGLEFQRRFVPHLERTDVSLIRQHARGYEVTTASGETTQARRVIVATGIAHFAYLPSILGGLPDGLISHSSHHSDLSLFKGRRVAVIGIGASGVDLAGLLHESGAEVSLIGRRTSIAFHEPSREPRPISQRILAPRSGLGTGWRSRLCTDAPLAFHFMPESFRHRVVQSHLGPAPGWFMKDRVVGRFPQFLGAEIKAVDASGGLASLEIEQEKVIRKMTFDHVIAATGFRPDMSRLAFIEDTLGRQISTAGYGPVLNRNFESSAAGLYFVGLASANSFGPLTRFAYGARFTARRLSKHLAGAVS